MKETKHKICNCSNCRRSMMLMTPRVKNAIDRAFSVVPAGCRYVGSEHLLEALAYDSDGPVAWIMEKLGVTHPQIKDAIKSLPVDRRTAK